MSSSYLDHKQINRLIIVRLAVVSQYTTLHQNHFPKRSSCTIKITSLMFYKADEGRGIGDTVLEIRK